MRKNPVIHHSNSAFTFFLLINLIAVLLQMFPCRSIFQELSDAIGVHIEEQPTQIPEVASLLHEVNTVNRQMMIQVESLRGGWVW